MKKGQIENLTDFFIIAFLLLIIFLVFGFGLFGGLNNNDKIITTNIAEFRQKEAAINNLKIQEQMGVDLEKIDIGQAIAESQIVNNKVITGCPDYANAVDCNSDAAGLYKNEKDKCSWIPNYKICMTVYSGGLS